MKKLEYYLSFLYPITVEVAKSQWNPVLEVVISNGKYLLNTQNSNYTNGTLHSVFEKAFKKLKPDWNKINDILILGFGAGSVARIIKKYNPDCSIEGIELDKKIIELGNLYFQTQNLKNTAIYCNSAENYLKQCNKKFDLVVIDLYFDIEVPKQAETIEFLTDIRNVLINKGIVVFNKFIGSKVTREQIPVLRDLYEKTFGNVKILTIMNRGKVFVSECNS